MADHGCFSTMDLHGKEGLETCGELLRHPCRRWHNPPTCQSDETHAQTHSRTHVHTHNAQSVVPAHPTDFSLCEFSVFDLKSHEGNSGGGIRREL